MKNPEVLVLDYIARSPIDVAFGLETEATLAHLELGAQIAFERLDRQVVPLTYLERTWFEAELKRKGIK